MSTTKVTDAMIDGVAASKLTGALPAISGASLTNLDARDLENALPAISGASLTALPATLPASSGVNLTALNATNLGSGTVPDARFPATLPVILLKDYGETTNDIGGTGGGTQDIDLTLGNSVTATVDTSANTFTFSNPTASDEGCGFTLVLTNGQSQGTVTWPASVDWAGGSAPTLTASGKDILTFWTVDGGTIWHGMVASTDSKSP